MTGIEGLTDRAASFIPAGTLRFPAGTAQVVHIRSRAAHVLYNAPEFRHLRHPGYLADNGFFAPALDDPSLVMREGAERAGAKASPVAGDRELDRGKGRDRPVIRRVGQA